MSFRSTGSCSRLEVKVIAAAYKYQKIDRGVLAIGCVRRANSARGPFAVGAQTNPVRGRGPFWNFCTRARSNLATQLKIELSVSSQLRLHAPSLDLFLGYIYVIFFNDILIMNSGLCKYCICTCVLGVLSLHVTALYIVVFVTIFSPSVVKITRAKE